MTRLAIVVAGLALTLFAAPDVGADPVRQGPGGGGFGPPPHRDGSHDRGREDRGGRGRSLSEAEVELAIATYREIDPAGARELEELRRREPQEVGRHIRERFPRVREFLALKERDPQLFDLRVQDYKLWRQSRELARDVGKARDADDRDRERELTDQLEKLAEEHFEVRQQIRQRELERLEAQLARLREQLEERADEKNDLIEQHVRTLIQGDSAEW